MKSLKDEIFYGLYDGGRMDFRVSIDGGHLRRCVSDLISDRVDWWVLRRAWREIEGDHRNNIQYIRFIIATELIDRDERYSLFL